MPRRLGCRGLEPFRLSIPDAQLTDLPERLRRTRWPERETAPEQGVPLADLQALCAYWADGYDWRATERRLNAIPQFRTEIDGLGIHFLHARSADPSAFPLIMSHGWPGSVAEYLDVVAPLTRPPAPFHLVIPSLPGYGFSDRPDGPGWGVERIARAWAELMRRLGYERYGAQGTDWGTSVSASLGQQDAEHVAGVHVMPPLAPPDPSTFDDLTDRERDALSALEEGERDSGYNQVHETRPQTVGYGLVDSPAGLCAWIVEKLRAWSDEPLTRDQELDAVMLYWLPGTAASSARLYWESMGDVRERMGGTATDTVDVPAGCTIWPKDNPRPSRRWAERRFTDIRHWSEPPRGGHFAALEQPELFVEEVRAFFSLVR